MSHDGDPLALLRLTIIGPLLACPPKRGELKKRIEELAAKTYEHPVTSEPVTFSFSTVERWYYQARDSPNPIEALSRHLRSDSGQRKVLNAELINALERQYRAHKSWSVKLHYDNLKALAQMEHPDWPPVPSYQTIRRCMQQKGWQKTKRRRPVSPGQQRALERLETRETRSYEAAYVHALWHLDFHQGRRRIVDASGHWFTPWALAVLDDCSRACCHIQWYRIESTETLIHGLSQAFAKRGLPRELMTDRGGAMLAEETQQGLKRLSIIHQPTLPYSPHQNAKQERFWGTLEGRPMKMLENVEPLTLELLNRATLAWVEMEYHREIHEEMGVTPLSRLMDQTSVARKAPNNDTLRFKFTACRKRTQRKGDGTVSIEGVRFELPSRLRHLRHVTVRYRRWDLSHAWVVDERTDAIIARIQPLDRQKNADSARRLIEPVAEMPVVHEENPIAPLLRKLLQDFAATGLPPAYVPHTPTNDSDLSKENNDD